MAKEEWNISNFTKGETFLVSYKNNLLFEVSPCTLLVSQFLLQKNDHPPTFSLSNWEFTWRVIWKKSLLICFESYWVSPIPTGWVLMVTLQHFAMVNITLMFKRVYIINICGLLFFILCKEKIEIWLVSPVNREFHCVEPTTFMSINWQKIAHW